MTNNLSLAQLYSIFRYFGTKYAENSFVNGLEDKKESKNKKSEKK